MIEAEKFWARVEIDPGKCWEWRGGKSSHGYGVLTDGHRYAHRYAYELLVGPIPADLQIDHLCRNLGCVNPAHLDAVSSRTNTLRGEGITAQEARQTHCKHGHEFTPENTYLPPHRPGRRECRTCRSKWARDRIARDPRHRGPGRA